MTRHSRLGKHLFAVGVVVLIGLNFYTFTNAYPETFRLTPGISKSGSILAKDFSAYYVSAWRFWHNPSQIYAVGAAGGGEPVILPHPQAYKYLPSFLLVISPTLYLNYSQALIVFDIFQFLLLPLIAFLLYSLLKTKGLVITFAVVVLALLTPTPVSNWGLSASYYWQWVEGQAKVLTTFLLLLSFYFGRRGQPYQSGIALAFGFFDPRFGLMALPLFVMYNRKKLKASILSVFASMLVFNAILLYPGLASGFIDMVWASAVTTPLYYYSFIPFLTLCSLIIVNLKEIATAFDYYGILAKYTGASKKRCWRW